MTLNAEDLRLVGREPGLPGLPWLLDADRFAELADQFAPAAGIVAAELTYLRYKPATSVLAAYRVIRRRGAPLLVQAKALPAARYRVVASRLAALAPAAPDQLAPRAIDPPQIVFLRPRDDRKLKAIAALCDPRQRQQLLSGCAAPFVLSGCAANFVLSGRAAPFELSGRAAPFDVAGGGIDDVEILRYKPERRLVACLHSGPRAVGLLRVVERTHYATALLGATLGAATCGAPLIGADARHQTLVTAWAEGEPLQVGGQQTDSVRPTDDVRAAGGLLARLHATRTLPPIRRPPRDELDAVRRALAMLAHLLPEVDTRLQGLLQRITRQLDSRASEVSLLHGDFSADQVIVDRGHCRFIDWDRCAAGAAAIDLGSFAARLEMQVIDGVLAPAAARATVAALHEGYRLTAGQLPAGVALRHSLALLQLATESFRRRLPDWPAREITLIDRAEALLREAEPAPPMTAGASQALDSGLAADAGAMPPDPLLAKVLDQVWLAPALRQALGPAYDDTRLRGIRLLRLKPGRRALIACDLDRGETVLGKLRYKGLDRQGFEIQRALARQRAALDASTTAGPERPDAARIPAVLGSVPSVGLWFQCWLPGTPATNLLRPDADPLIGRRIGAALADLHASPVPTRRCWTVDDELAVLGARLARAGQQRPDLAPRIDTVLAACAVLAADLPPTAPTGIHRDFHPGQVLIDGERLVFVDFDLYALGDPALDVGNWLAHLIELGLRHHGGPAALTPLIDGFVDGYRGHGPTLPDAAVTGWTTLSLARHIALSLGYADRHATTDTLLTLCEQRLAHPDGPTCS